MDARCAKHQFEGADNFCRQCGHPFCVRCLLYPFGERKPPYCIPCALVASGVRSGKKIPKASWRERRAQRRAAFEAPPAQAEPAIAAAVDRAPPTGSPTAEPIQMEPAFDPTWSQPLSGDDPWFTSGDQHPASTTNELGTQPLDQQPLNTETLNQQTLNQQTWSPSHSSERSFG